MLKLAQNEFTATWILESLAKSNIEEVVFAVSKNPSTPKATKAAANQDSTAYSNKQNVADHDRQIAELRREITQIKKAYNSLLISLESRDKEISELLEAINKNSSQRTSRSTSYVTFSIGEF
jgi:chromosome segregation ATPase